jgi:hypothetical protein
MFNVSEEINGNVRVTIEHAGRVFSEIWKMSVANAMIEAEEILSRWKK